MTESINDLLDQLRKAHEVQIGLLARKLADATDQREESAAEVKQLLRERGQWQSEAANAQVRVNDLEAHQVLLMKDRNRWRERYALVKGQNASEALTDEDASAEEPKKVPMPPTHKDVREGNAAVGDALIKIWYAAGWNAFRMTGGRSGVVHYTGEAATWYDRGYADATSEYGRLFSKWLEKDSGQQ